MEEPEPEEVLDSARMLTAAGTAEDEQLAGILEVLAADDDDEDEDLLGEDDLDDDDEEPPEEDEEEEPE